MGLVSDPALTIEVVAKISTPNDSYVVQFEALDVVHATDLVDSVGIGGPQASWGDARREAPIPGLGIPRPAIVANYNIID